MLTRKGTLSSSQPFIKGEALGSDDGDDVGAKDSEGEALGATDGNDDGTIDSEGEALRDGMER